ncbi:hypothetical protein [Catellatospora sp. NPDC049609]|uniref:hypothetical protein n=1 Tax=Catellatospora sp. NPDC049609 TaxID=3155505 RepID=UPI0034453836
MPSKANDVVVGADGVVNGAADAGAAIAAKAADVKQVMVAAGHDVAGKAGEAKDAVAQSAVTARDAAGAALSAVGERLPRSGAEWQAVGREMLDGVRRNPKPYAAAAGLLLVGWLLGRRSSAAK